ncbi:MAG: prepilin-type N-terminal cleavage/methylation domain-containing protein [Lentisphaeria bacterium]|nr:prepilin-type N-terminal cleavage/methylation domain-containing protein [Lentisphaeria bacterium]
MNKKTFTLIEILVVISIIGVLVAALASSLGGAVDKAKITEARGKLTGLDTAAKTYRTTYGKPPKRLEDLLENNNPRRIEFLNEIPIDSFSISGQAEVKVIYNVSDVKKDKDGNISIIETEGNGMIIYSVGPNQEDDGGLNDGKVSQEEQDTAKDDIAVYLDF